MFATATTLNEEQAAVAEFDGGPLRVLAGAGTGKTTALTARVAHLVDRGTRPERVLLLTFTLRAHGPRVGLADGFSVLDPADAAALFDLVREEHGWARRTDRRLPRKQLL